VSQLIRNYTAAGAISARRIVKVSGAGNVAQTTGVSDGLFGICSQPGGAALGERCDTTLTGIEDVEAGAAFAAGARLTSDAQGRAINAAPAAGVNNDIIGIALVDATAAGDIIPVLIGRQTLQG